MTFTKENVQALKLTCDKISGLTKESVDGQFMLTQLEFLGNLIKEFRDNPIVKNSGIINIS